MGQSREVRVLKMGGLGGEGVSQSRDTRVVMATGHPPTTNTFNNRPPYSLTPQHGEFIHFLTMAWLQKSRRAFVVYLRVASTLTVGHFGDGQCSRFPLLAILTTALLLLVL